MQVSPDTRHVATVKSDHSKGEILVLFTTDLELEYSLMLQTAQE
ncbi:bifunctional acyl-[acyl carrier protein] synthetase/2-acylglycerophosphoethanolamine acyltransferase [Photorhabdus temperata subsp. temperata M1021]|nr:bifunctional acyl-[acyl carrier protein] synthetase/2-acylglycerophosphoethanolamine acyltransferase [Photorhabdus temperata subsp. temperata M1021]